MPVAWRTTAAKAHTTSPGPQATSSTVSSGAAPANSTSSRSASSSRMPGAVENGRSEEHTSELQSPDHLVCRLLLEKKKKTIHCCRRHVNTVYSTKSTA